MRIWYQSFTHEDESKAYLDRLRAHLRSVADRDTEIVVHTLYPSATNVHPITEMRLGVQVVKNAVQAQEEGYDAFAVGHFQDSGLMESKSVVDIPVLGLGETTMLHACTLARKTGLVTIHPVFIPWHEDQIAAYGLGSRMTGVRAMTTSPLDYVAALSDRAVYEGIREQFVAQAQPFVDEGVDALIPAGGLPMLLLASEHGFNVGGAPVLNGINILVKQMEAAVKLKAIDGTAVSRRSNFARPSDSAMKDFLGK